MGTLLEADRALGAALVAISGAAFISLVVMTPRSFQIDARGWPRVRVLALLTEILLVAVTMAIIFATLIPSLLLAGAYEEISDEDLRSLLTRVQWIIALVAFLFLIRQIAVPMLELLADVDPLPIPPQPLPSEMQPEHVEMVREVPVRGSQWPAVVSAAVTTAGWLYLVRQNSRKPPTS